MVINNRLEWTTNMDICCKRASQQMFFLRKLKQFHLSSQLLHQFYQLVVEKTVLFNHVCWYNNAKKVNVDRLNHTAPTTSQNHRTAGQDPGVCLPWVLLVQVQMPPCWWQPPAPSWGVCMSAQNLPFVKARMNRLRNSFLPTAVRQFNDLRA